MSEIYRQLVSSSSAESLSVGVATCANLISKKHWMEGKFPLNGLTFPNRLLFRFGKWLLFFKILIAIQYFPLNLSTSCSGVVFSNQSKSEFVKILPVFSILLDFPTQLKFQLSEIVTIEWKNFFRALFSFLWQALK